MWNFPSTSTIGPFHLFHTKQNIFEVHIRNKLSHAYVLRALQTEVAVTQGPDLGASVSLCGYLRKRSLNIEDNLKLNKLKEAYRFFAEIGCFSWYISVPHKGPDQGLSHVQEPPSQLPFNEQSRSELHARDRPTETTDTKNERRTMQPKMSGQDNECTCIEKGPVQNFHDAKKFQTHTKRNTI